jgi:hypothetical protein
VGSDLEMIYGNQSSQGDRGFSIDVLIDHGLFATRDELQGRNLLAGFSGSGLTLRGRGQACIVFAL